MATNKCPFTLRLSDEMYDKIGILAKKEHRSMSNYIEYVLLKHINEIEKEQGKIKIDQIEQRQFITPLGYIQTQSAIT